MLPPGTRPIPEIERQPDPIHRLRDAATLLEHLLVSASVPTTGETAEYVDLVDRVKGHRAVFRNIGDVLWALGVRNDITTPASSHKSPTPSEVHRAASHLVQACREAVEHVPSALREAVMATGDSDRLPAAQPVEPLSWRSIRKLVAGIGLAILVLLSSAAVAYWVWPVDPNSPEGMRRAAARQSEAERAAASTSVRALLQAQAERARRVLAATEELTRQIDRYEREFLPLLESASGRAITADAQGTTTLAALYMRARPSREDAARLAERVRRDMLGPIEAATKAAHPVPLDTRFDALIDDARAEADTGARSYAQLCDTAVTVLKANAGREGVQSLSAAFADFKSKLLAEEAAATEKVIAAERAAAAGRAGEAERRKIRADAQLQQAATDRATLEAYSTNPKMLAIFEHMLGPGRIHWSVASSGAKDSLSRFVTGHERREISRPLSYTELTQAGVLKDWRSFAHFGARRDYRFGDNNYCKLAFSENDRVGSAWGYPSTEDDVKEAELRLEYFKKLAPFWIEQGKLLK